MERRNQSLDGRWQIAFDPGNVGKQRNWNTWGRFVEDAPREYIDVPACWERFRQDYEGVAWYGHTFTVPPEWQNSAVRIRFGAVNYLTEVYINDEAIGYHEGGYTDFAFEISDVLRFGDDETNTLVLRVIGPIITQDIEIDGIGRDDMPHWRGAIAGGIWQSVELQASARLAVTDLFADPNVAASRVRVEGKLENLDLTCRDVDVALRVIPVGIEGNESPSPDAVATAALRLEAMPGETTFEAEISIDSPCLWSPDSPYLYRLETEVSLAGAVIDTHTVRFGMRELVISDRGYWLNGEKLLVKSAFFEALYPTSLAGPADEAIVRKELQLAKDASFNLLRPWRKPQPPIVYDLADEMGVLFAGTMPIECMSRWPTMTPYAERRMRNEVRESVRRDRNHPCIVVWEIFNEIMRPSLRRIKHRITREARAVDPSRFILDESGGFGGGAFFYPPNSTEPFQINDVHSYPGAPFDQQGYEKLLALGKTEAQLKAMGRELPKVPPNHGSKQIFGGFVHVSEIGYGSLPDLEANVEQYRKEGNPLTPDYRFHHELLDHYNRVLDQADFRSIFPTVKAYCDATQEIHAAGNKQMLEAIRINPDIDGFTIHAYTDGDWIVGAGLLDIFRNPKKPYYAAQETNQPLYLALRTARRNVYPETPLALTAIAASESAEAIDARLEVEIRTADGDVLKSFSRDVRIAQGSNKLLAEQIDTQDLNGLCSVHGRLGRHGEAITENTYEFRVLPAPQVQTSTSLAVLDPWGAVSRALDTLGMRHMPFTAGTPPGTLVIANARALEQTDATDVAATLPDFIARGGVVLYLELPGGKPIGGKWGGDQILQGPWLPRQLLMRHSRGLWSPFSHIIRKHPIISRGLDAGKIMDDDYVNVYPHVSILNVAEGNPEVSPVGIDRWSDMAPDACRAPVSTLGLGWRPGAFTDDRDYRGPGPVMLGLDLIDWPCGDGKALFSTLRLLASVGQDPVADTLLANIIEWAEALQ